ncbi:MAG TPA: TonB-dependent receptor [Candidatus Acidoferrales bacterium]|nr:TonB-dependent receptor [Candidatus Acidoferrales bacterium]
MGSNRSNGLVKREFGAILWGFLVLSICLAVSVPAHTQVVGATLSGTVKDASGSAIPGAQVSVKNVATSTVRELTADSAGFYSVPNLIPGNYEVTYSAQGFSTQVSSGITLTVGAQQVLNVTLTVGQVSQKVVVTGEAPIVELASSTISGEVSATTVRELPLNGRSWTDLAALSPGVNQIHTQVDFSSGSDRGNRGFGAQLTISGTRPQQNNYRLDGVSLNDYANGAPGSVLGGNLGVDAIQEFTVLTSNYSAEYGKTSGGVVNAVTRSGTNAFHGSAYEFFRNSKLDAANFFEAGQRSPFKRNQFGGDVGGPIIKDRTFFFADYEGIRQSLGVPNVDTVPSPNARLGILSTGNVIVDPQVMKYLALYPVPQSCGQDACPFIFSGQQVVNENFVTTRIDHKFSDKDSLFGTYLLDRTTYNAPDNFNNVELGHRTARQFVVAEETHSFSPTLVNSVRFGYNRDYVNDNQSLAGLNPAASDQSLGAFANRDASFVNVGGLTSMPGGVGGLPTYVYHWNSFQAYDDAFLTRGTHSIKFGVAVERMLSYSVADTDPNGVWFFPDLPSFLQNAPNKFQGGLHTTVTPRNLQETLVGAYMQDDWRVRPSLTLNLGLRYETTTVPTEANGKFINLRNFGDQFPVCGTVTTLAGQQACSGPGALFSNPTLHNFEPRLGFAWDALHNGKLAVRGGAGMFDVLPLPYQITLMETQASPFFEYVSLKASNPNPQPLTFPLVPPADYANPNVLRSSYFDSHPKRSYVMQWNLSLQYQLTPNLAAMVAYVGSRGVHLPYRVDDANLILPSMTSAGLLYPTVDVNGNLTQGPNAGQAATPINQFFSSVHGMFYQSQSYYNALQAQVSKHISHGFQLQGVFTWSKSMDDNSATVAGDTFANSISSLNWYDQGLTRALSDFNVGRNLTLSGTWDVPSPKSLSGFARWPLDGWELGLIFTVADGVPFTPTWGTGSDPANTLSSDDYAYPNRLFTPGCASLVNPGNPNNYIKTQCFTVPQAPTSAFWTANCDQQPPSAQPSSGPVFTVPALQCWNLRGNSGRNILTGPGLTDLDFSVYKNNYIKRISEAFNVQFRAEFFNILNHANFGPPTPGDSNTDIFTVNPGLGAQANPISGQLVRTTTSQREIQFALKFIW